MELEIVLSWEEQPSCWTTLQIAKHMKCCVPVWLTRLLHELAPDEAAFYAQGAQEVEEMIAEENGEEDTAPDEPQAASTVGDLFKKA